MLRFCATTLVADGFRCGTCPEDVARRRGCSRRRMPRPAIAPFDQQLPDGSRVERWDCPQAMKTPEIAGIFRAYLHHRDGRLLYPSLREYPEGLLRRIEAVDSEVRAAEAERAASAARSAGR